MDKNKAIATIEETFDHSFDKETFIRFVKNLLNDIDVSENKYREYRGNLIKESFRSHIAQYTRIGKYIDPNGVVLDVLAVEVQDSSKLDKARTSLRNFVIDHLEKFDKDFALAAFYSKSDGGRNWRFSFIKLEQKTTVEDGRIRQERQFTPARRYSFLVGEDEKSHTAKRQLLPLLQNVYNNPTIEDIEKAFSIEVVTDEFFGQYKELFLHISEHLDSDIQIKSILETAGTDIPRFTKKLLGHIVFLYFLQKKGWMGVLQNDKWGTGRKNFLQSLYDKADAEGKNFFNTCLRYLFYEALARQHGDDNYYSRLDCRIPFLNGGLFEANYDWETYEINLPNTLFRNNEAISKTGDVGTGILDVFDRYNFTIREDEPLEKEVAIDPEMLGKVFENMLEITERKSKGAFYTPREIVHYMCQESLIHYLDTALNERKTFEEFGTGQTHLFGNETNTGQLDIYKEHENTVIQKNEIEDFVHNGIFYIEHDIRVSNKGKETDAYSYKLPESIRQNADKIDCLLTDIKICDPAIGSGAFPVGLLNELVTLQLVLCNHLSGSYLAKKLNTIGLKIEEYDRNPEKYLYRVKRHNIQESIYGVDIDASAIDIARLRLWLSLVVDEEDFDNIEALPNLDYKIVCGNSLIKIEKDLFNSHLFVKLEQLKTAYFNETNDKTKLKEEIDQTFRLIASGKTDFDFDIYFSEVFNNNKGFDIVIGNPPYVQLQNNGGALANQFENCGYKTFARTGDIYCLFYERGWQLLKPQGHLCFITSNKWMRAGYGENTRRFFAENTNPTLLIDFAGVKVFDSATVDVNILMFQKDKNRQETSACIVKKSGIKDLGVFVRQNGACCNFAASESWVVLSPIEQRIKQKIEAVGTPLKDWDIQINYGIKTGFNDAFIISGEKRKELIEQDAKSAEIIRPILRGRDIKRYGYDFADLWLINTHNGYTRHCGLDPQAPKNKKVPPVNINDYPAVKQHLDSYWTQIKKRQDQGDTPYNLRNCAYIEDFYRQKIIFSELTQGSCFIFDETGDLFTLQTGYIIVGNNLKYLLSMLNSKFIEWAFRKFYSIELGGSGLRWLKQYVETIPIPKPTPEIEQRIESLLQAKDYQAIDNVVYKLYGLTEEEINCISTSDKSSS